MKLSVCWNIDIFSWTQTNGNKSWSLRNVIHFLIDTHPIPLAVWWNFNITGIHRCDFFWLWQNATRLKFCAMWSLISHLFSLAVCYHWHKFLSLWFPWTLAKCNSSQIWHDGGHELTNRHPSYQLAVCYHWHKPYVMRNSLDTDKLYQVSISAWRLSLCYWLESWWKL